MGGFDMMGGYGYGGGWMMLVFWVFIIALIAWLVVMVARPEGLSAGRRRAALALLVDPL